MSVSKKILEHPVLTLCVFMLIAIVAVFTLGNINLALMPDMDVPVAMVMTTYENAGPETVEKSVTEVLESGLVSVNNMKEMTSTSSEGSSLIQLEFNYGTDMDVAVNDIRDKLDMVKGSLPDEADTPTIFQFSSSSMPIMTLAINGNRTEEELKKIADDQIADRIEQADGVAQASVNGGRDSIVRVELDLNRLEAYGLTLSSVAATLASQNIEVGGGNVSEGTKKYMVRTTGEFSSIEEINKTVVGSYNGYDVKIEDIGTAFMGYSDITSKIYINGRPGVYIRVRKQSGANTVNVAKNVKEKIAQIEKTLPSDVKIEIISDDSTSVSDTMKELVKSIIEGFVLAVLILLVFLRSGKATFIMAISIPFSVLITLTVMSFAGITMNMITMTGLILGLGMVVDASVVVLENIYVYRNRGTAAITAAAIGTQEVMASVVSGNLTTICVFIPFFVFKNQLGMLGQLFSSLMSVILIALLSSLFVAMFLVPVLAGKFLPVDSRMEKPLKSRFLASCDRAIGKAIDWVTEKYRKGLHVVLHHRFTTCVIAFGILVLSGVLATRLKISFMSQFNDTSVGLNIELPLGTKLEETENILNAFYEIAREEVNGYENIVVSVGSGSGFSTSDTSYEGSITIYLPDVSEQIDKADDIQRKLRKHFADYPNAEFTFDDGTMRQMTGADIDIVFRSNNLDLSLATAKEIKKLIEDTVPALTEPEIDMQDGLPQVEIKVDRARASSFGISVMSIANEINYCINGKTATSYRSDGDSYDVVVLLTDEDRSDIPDLEKIYVSGNSGLVSVANFAEVVRGTGPVSINREDQTRIIHLTANLSDSSLNAGQVENQIKQLISDTMVIPEDVSITYEGSWADTTETSGIFAVIIFLAVILVFGVMAGTYEDFKDPFINLFTMPFLIVGVVLVHLITGQAFSMVSLIGVVMLIGIVVNNGIILVDQTNLLVRRGVPVLEACEQAGASRLRPVLMTTLTTILAMIPMAFFSNDSSSMTQPIGLCVVGGLTSSTIVTMFIIPVIYSLFNKKGNVKGKGNLPPELLAIKNGTSEDVKAEEKND